MIECLRKMNEVDLYAIHAYDLLSSKLQYCSYMVYHMAGYPIQVGGQRRAMS